MTRPVLNCSEAVNVKFIVQLNAVVDVDKKGQVVSTDTFIKQSWNNSFFMWSPNDFGGLERILVSPEEIWAPDIVLHNNEDDYVAQAGYTEKFKTWIIIYHNGTSEWNSPVSFKSSCNFDVTYFPYDEHRCELIFGSPTSDITLMDIVTDERRLKREKGQDRSENIEKDDGDEAFEVENNGGWSIQRVEVKRRVVRHKGYPHPFTKIQLRFVIRRKPLHFVVFSMVPCMLIGALILVSFFIPAESGERIGFSCTILLSVSVYLLIVTEALPEQSDTLPLIAVYYIIIMVEIGLALTATIVVLKAHHSTSKPPAWLKWCLFINKIYRCCRNATKRRTSKIESPAVSVVVLDCDSINVDKCEKEQNQTGEDRRRKSSFIDFTRLTEHRSSQLFTRPSSRVNMDEEEEDWSETWRQIGKALDRIFFWTFVISFFISTVVVFTYGPSLAKPLNAEMNKLYDSQ
ncbi:neuronal acetylcholine receptor subunit beta-3-like [Porites lutea]|uniref:neuronal acetylcholine receptor subunit beta-3-like n=1 Tax=Porites lutea TaxID=51062 RepID=UPI003CC5CAFC